MVVKAETIGLFKDVVEFIFRFINTRGRLVRVLLHTWKPTFILLLKRHAAERVLGVFFFSVQKSLQWSKTLQFSGAVVK